MLASMIEGIAIVGILVMSIVLHEVAHGWMANALGDPTARLQGRLSANPISHIDPIGSVLIPGLLYLTSAGFIFGWAKPVPYNPHLIRAPFGLHHKWAEALVAFAGPAMNIVLALTFAALIRIAPTSEIAALFIIPVYVNTLLAFFNFIPFPPLDGSKILSALLPRHAAYSYDRAMRRIESYGMFASLLFIFVFITFFSAPFFTFVTVIVSALTQ